VLAHVQKSDLPNADAVRGDSDHIRESQSTLARSPARKTADFHMPVVRFGVRIAGNGFTIDAPAFLADNSGRHDQAG
jgi:hypothetical protein